MTDRSALGLKAKVQSKKSIKDGYDSLKLSRRYRCEMFLIVLLPKFIFASTKNSPELLKNFIFPIFYQEKIKEIEVRCGGPVVKSSCICLRAIN